MPNDPSIVQYHQQSKHHLHAYARGPGQLDWASQPDPFRRYEGATLIPLQHLPPEDKPLYAPAFVVGQLEAEPMNRKSVSQLFYDSLALSAWKLAGEIRWSLRVNPSSGNLHPTEGYLICGPVEGLSKLPMVCHYAPKEHALERRAVFPVESWRLLTSGLPKQSILIGLSSIYWREAWKYGERAFRYCQHDVGHAIGAMSIAAAGLGWEALLLDDIGYDSLEELLGLFDQTGPDAEHPDCLLAVFPHRTGASEPTLTEEHLSNIKNLSWEGRPNALSSRHVSWPAIDEASATCRKPTTNRIYGIKKQSGRVLKGDAEPISLRKMIHQRRSAVDFDGHTRLTREGFYQMLLKTLPVPGQVPFNTLPWNPVAHLGLFVHRVEDLDPGLYFLLRDITQIDNLKSEMKKDFDWIRPQGCPEGLDLYQLAIGDARQLAEQISCGQKIASDGCFSLGMIIEFEQSLKLYGEWFYSRLYWECGAIGQVLYLEAEAQGIRGTGIGCFFDEPVHSVFGFKGLKWQSLYHFTIGGPVEDLRLTVLPAYGGVE
ncbi:MAG: SagB/ThcOx family dehydrogenase [Nitrospiria bacterium]